MKLRIGLLIDSELESSYIYDFVKWAKIQDDLDVTHLIIQRINTPNKNDTVIKKLRRFIHYRGLNALISYIIFQFLKYFEYQKLKRNSRYKNHFKLCNLSDLIDHKINITPQVSKSGFVYRFSDTDIEEITKNKFDLIIRVGSGILHGKILNASKFGVLSFHHADNSINRGGPPGFWEVFLRQPTTGFTLQILTEELDGGHVIMKGKIPTRGYFLLNQAALYEISNIYLKQLIKKIALTKRLPEIESKLPYFNPLYKLPDLGIIFKYTFNTIAFIASRFIFKFFKYDYIWDVGYLEKKWNEISFWKATKFNRPKGHFLADPFVVSENGKKYCFVEDFVFNEKKGQIAVYDLTGKKPFRMGVVIKEPFHLSFPNIFKYEDEYYICPESSANKDIRLYKSIEFPLKWELTGIAMSNISAVDTIIFKRDYNWWLFTNIDSNNSGDHHSELFIYFASSPITNSWKPHTMNPIYIDASCARNGGIIEEDGKIYRVCQKHGFGHYGRNISINEIVELTENSFKENQIYDIHPNFFPKISGIHHMHGKDGLTVFDFARWQRI